MTKPIIVMKVPCKLLYVIQVKEFLIKCSTSWPYLISEFLIAYITIVASDWPRTFFTPKVFLFSYYLSIGNSFKNIYLLNYKCRKHGNSIYLTCDKWSVFQNPVTDVVHMYTVLCHPLGIHTYVHHTTYVHAYVCKE